MQRPRSISPGTRRSRVADVSSLAPRLIMRQSLHTHASAKLRDMIVEDELSPGTRLVEADLCALLGISRTPLREAFKVLASEGLVELLPNRGARVTGITRGETKDLFEVIAGLEALAVDSACERMSAEELAELETMHKRLLEWHRKRRRREYFALNHRIHEAVVAFSRNKTLVDTHARLLTRARRSRYRAILTVERWDESVREHDELMRALVRRDARAASAVWRKHVLRTGEIVARALEAEEAQGAQAS